MNAKSSTVSWILQILVALILGASAIAKLSDQEAPIMVFESLGMEPTGRYLIGGLELIAAFLLIIRFSAAWGAILAWGLMTGALIGHFTQLGMSGKMLPMTLAATFNWIASAAIIVLRHHQIGFIRRMFACDSK